MVISQSSSRNALLAGLTPDDYASIQPRLTRLPLPLRLNLHEAGAVIEWVYFPEDGVASVVATDNNGKQVEVGIFGSEGMSATAVVLGTDRSSHHVYMQIEGVSGLRISSSDLRHALNGSATLRIMLLHYVQAAMVQSASSTAAAAGYTIEQRLARWLLMCHDRVEGDEVRLTHESISAMLGTRRSGVTVALRALASRLLITTSRGNVTIEDRDGLERLASSSYGFAEVEYERLIGKRLHNAKPGATRRTRPQHPMT